MGCNSSVVLRHRRRHRVHPCAGVIVRVCSAPPLQFRVSPTVPARLPLVLDVAFCMAVDNCRRDDLLHGLQRLTCVVRKRKHVLLLCSCKHLEHDLVKLLVNPQFRICRILRGHNFLNNHTSHHVFFHTLHPVCSHSHCVGIFAWPRQL